VESRESGFGRVRRDNRLSKLKDDVFIDGE